jgi:hypothetical protein
MVMVRSAVAAARLETNQRRKSAGPNSPASGRSGFSFLGLELAHFLGVLDVFQGPFGKKTHQI